MIERRTTHRRRYQASTHFPLMDQHQGLVASDRRHLPTRRVNDILVEEVECSDYLYAVNKKS